MSIDLTEIPIIDDHAHPFLPEKENSDLRSYWTTSLLAGNTEHVSHLLVYRRMLAHLKKLIGTDDDAREDLIWRQRNESYAADRPAYIAKLFADAKIEMLFVDIGYPTKSISGYDVDLRQLEPLLPCPVRAIVRIEPIMVELAHQRLGFNEYSDAFVATLEQAIAAQETVALKTAVAYFTGLNVKRSSREDVKRSFEAYMKDPARFGLAGPFLNHLIHVTFGVAKGHSLPVQIHTGFGNAPLLDLGVSNPVLLFDLLGDSECQDTPIVLLHAGYPYVREVSYLANNYPNVRVDVSQVSQYVGAGLGAVLADLLSMAPVNKILYGSDGLGCPELYWWPARNVKECLGLTLERLVSDGFATQTTAMEIAKRILHQNASELYARPGQ